MIYKPTNRTGRNLETINELVRNGLAGCWVAMGSGNTLIDISGRGYHAAITTGRSWSLGRDGRRPAMYCDGTGGTGLNTGYSLPASGEFTVVVRLKPDPGNTTTGRYVWSQELSGADIGLTISTAGFTYTNDGAIADTVGPAGQYPSDWVDHAVVDFRLTDVDNNAYWIDGKPATGGGNNAAAPANTTFYISGRSSTSPFFGWIEHVFVLEKALNTSELAVVTNPTFDLFKTSPRRSYSIPVSGGGKPDHYYRMMRNT